MSSVGAVGAAAHNLLAVADTPAAADPSLNSAAADPSALSESDDAKRRDALSSPAGIAVRLLASLPDNLGRNSDVAA